MAATAPARQPTVSEKKLEQILAREEKADAQHVEHSIKDFKSAEKAEGKAEKAADNAVHGHDKAAKQEHKASKALSKATHAHDSAVADEQKAARDVEIKHHHQAQLEQDLATKKAAVEEAQKRKETHNSMREAKRAEVAHAGEAAIAPQAVA